MLSCIVLSGKKSLQKKFLEALAISPRCDESVSRTQLDKIYLMVKLVSPTGVAENVFLGAAEPQTNGTKGLHDTILTACARTVRLGSDDDLSMQEAKKLFCRASLLVTDGHELIFDSEMTFGRYWKRTVKILNSMKTSRHNV